MTSGLKIVNMGIHTCEGIQLEVSAGQCIGLTGPSGTGKTLLLRALADLDPHQGEVWLDGVCRSDIPAHQWRRKVGLLPAESAWWHDKVRPHLQAVSPEALQALGFDNTVLDWSIRRLSSGERQRLALLRLLDHHPRVLLLDEPTANLDSVNRTRVETLLNHYRQDQRAIILWVSHDQDQLQRLCRPVYTIQNHQLILAADPVAQVREDT